jgi:hypothetical protein
MRVVIGAGVNRADQIIVATAGAAAGSSRGRAGCTFVSRDGGATFNQVR